MSKANKSARQKVVGGLNWWDFLNSIRPRGFRNTPQYLDYDKIINRASEIKKINKTIKNRKKQEKKQLRNAKHNKKGRQFDKIVKPTKKARANMIEYGIALGKWWSEQHEI